MANEKRLDLISRTALLAEYDRVHIGEPGKARKLIANAPTVDAVEVVHAEWDVIEDDYNFDTIYKCSACKEEFVTIDGTPAENLWNYCPNCGAKMDGGNEDG